LTEQLQQKNYFAKAAAKISSEHSRPAPTTDSTPPPLLEALAKYSPLSGVLKYGRLRPID